METTRNSSPGVLLGGGGGVLLALLGATSGVLAGVLPWAALPAAWLGSNAAVVLGAHVLTKSAKRARQVPIRGRRMAGDAARG